MEQLSKIIGLVNNALYSYLLIALLLVLGTYFSIRTGFIQVRMIGEMFRLLSGKSSKTKKGISSFQAFCISIASCVGTGNLAGVAIAIVIGGPGAVFWMWLIALIGACSSLIECTLAQIYKIKDGEHFRGGPAYYMERALGKRWMGIIFSILISITYGLIFNSVQANTMSFAFEKAFGISRLHVGMVLATVTAVIIFGGIKRIAHVVEILVPVMAVAYILVALFIIVKNIAIIPSIISLIFSSAFGLRPVAGGLFGVVIMQGIKRGLFSNEAGMGSAPNAAATSDVSHPVKQGLVQALGVFTDTIVICSCTAFIILISGNYTSNSSNGIQLTQDAIVSQVGSWGSIFIAACILFFAFSSVIGNYYYGETNIEFIKANKMWLTLYRIAVVAMVLFGCVAQIQIVWDLADLFMGLMATMNLLTIAVLARIAIAAVKDYQKQRSEGKDPVFKASSIPGLKNTECWDD
ncbi:sodium:alanine symporter family protein [Fusobacterium sp.]|uniref:alanine/glycine:cation symporter family protein n=1 Tax=Fusobacterium sp. TaxID=68766 RepID=UPI00260BA519|nr:alanine/glycine:cation symporter family protein [Fusobacterium sp.]